MAEKEQVVGRDGPAPLVEGAQDQPPDAGQHSEGDLCHPGIVFEERASLLYRHQGDRSGG